MSLSSTSCGPRRIVTVPGHTCPEGYRFLMPEVRYEGQQSAAYSVCERCERLRN